MGISVNGVEITDQAVERELPHHANAPTPVKAAAEALVLKEVLLQAARNRLSEEQGGLPEAMEAQEEDAEALLADALIERLIEREVVTPEPTMQECENYYRKNLEQFRNGDLVEASHILFQMTQSVPLEMLRAKAEEVLQEALSHPEQFEELARTYSNCTSSEQGGNLGQLTKGQTVPEFERVIFSLEEGQIAPKLVETRFGLHIVRVARRAEGKTLPFELVHEKLAQYLAEQVRKRALQQYLKILVGQADIQGIEIEAARTPLVQ